jgi:hypothetical protein
MSALIESWVREAAGLKPEAVVQVEDEPHCPDPACPLRHTAISWADAAGKTHRAVIVKPPAYVRRPDVERALRLYTAMQR